MTPDYVFARQAGELVLPYADREEIDRGYLEGRDLEIAWAKSKVEVFFAHVQGAARLRFEDGKVKRVTYAAKAGHAFSPIGKLLIERGEIAPSDISMQSIRSWLSRNPERVDEVLWHNRSYIFFREADVSDPALGPIAAAKVPLIPGRSLAVDRQIHTFGFPFFIHAEDPCLHLTQDRPLSGQRAAISLQAPDTRRAKVRAPCATMPTSIFWSPRQQPAGMVDEERSQTRSGRTDPLGQGGKVHPRVARSLG
jgi:membrane-bound lytic murein transglycosylase A